MGFQVNEIVLCFDQENIIPAGTEGRIVHIFTNREFYENRQ